MITIEAAVQQRLDNLIKPRGSLGKIEGMLRRYAVLRGTADPEKLWQGAEELEEYFRSYPEAYEKVFSGERLLLLQEVSQEMEHEYALSLLVAGLRCYREMGTFAQAGIEV